MQQHFQPSDMTNEKLSDVHNINKCIKPGVVPTFGGGRGGGGLMTSLVKQSYVKKDETCR